jgi:hypothetical protein
MNSTPTLLPPAPRRVRGGIGGREYWLGRIFILPHTLVGIGAAGYLLFLLLWRLFGSDIPGVVTGTEISTSSKGGITYLVKYQYEVGGERKSGAAGVKLELYQRYRLQSEPKPGVTIHYFALGPLEHAVLREGGSLWTEIGMLALWAGFWNTVVVAALHQVWIVPLRVRGLYKNGEATFGTLVSKRIKTGRSASYYATYTFREGVTGELRQVESEVWNVPAWNAMRAGEPVTVLYAPNNPKRSTVYELGGYWLEDDEERFRRLGQE